jgi:hypothetical protein
MEVENSLPAPLTAICAAQDMHEMRDVDRVDSHLVSPVSLIACLAWKFYGLGYGWRT